MHKPLHLHLHSESGEARSFPLPVGEALEVGRDRSHAAVFVSDLGCARRHMRVDRVGASRVLVHDLGAGPGTLVVSGVADRVELARRLVHAPAELRVVHDGLVVCVSAHGVWRERVGNARVLHGTSALVPADALVIVPGAILHVDHRPLAAIGDAQTLVAPSSPGARAEPASSGWEALDAHGLRVTRLAELALSGARAIVPVIAHPELFADAPRLPGFSAEVSGAALSQLLRRLGEQLPERAFAPIELVVRGAGDELSPRTAAVVRHHGELRYIERALEHEAEIGTLHDLLRRWLALGSARTSTASGGTTASGSREQPYALAIGTGSELTELESPEALARFTDELGAVDHFIDLTSPRPYARRGAEPTDTLTPAEASILLGFVVRALTDGRPMRPESYPNPFSTTPMGRRHAFKTMRLKTDRATERGRYRLFPTISTSTKGGSEYAFAPRNGVSWCVLVLGADYARARAWLGEANS